MEINLNGFAKEVHELAGAQGFHNFAQTDDHYVESACNNLHDEICELHDSWREGTLLCYCNKANVMIFQGNTPLTNLEEELADLIIRALDMSQRLGIENMEKVLISKHEYNKIRPYRHRNKKS